MTEQTYWLWSITHQQWWNVMSEQIDFNTMIEVDNPSDTDSWLKGFLSACSLFGVWKDGKQRLGNGSWTVKKVRQDILRFVQEVEK